MPRKQLTPNPMPSWLSSIDETSVFRKEDVINGSVYYPGAGLDHTVIHAYSGFAHSFVYVDYSVDKKDIWNSIQRLAGYEVVIIRELNLKEIINKESERLELRRDDFYPRVDNEEIIAERLNILYRRNRYFDEGRNNWFCIWVIYHRRSTTNLGHGPERISLLYIKDEGVATYKAIYNTNCFKPTALVIKGADIGFGRNWTLFEKNNAIFERTVLANKAGIPKYLFADGRYGIESGERRFTESAYWSNYLTEIPNRSFLRIWTVKANTKMDEPRKLSKKMSKTFIDWYNEKSIEIWDKFPDAHPYLPKVLGTNFNINAPICYVGMNPSFNAKAIRAMMNRPDFDGYTPDTLHQNSLSDRKKRINLLKLLENIAAEEYSRYFQPIREFNESLDLGFTDLSFLDLFIVRQTDQMDVQKLMGQPRYYEFRKSQLSLFLSALERINTKYICVLNAGASSYLCEYLNNGKIVSSYEYKGKLIFFAGMLSGGGMDRFSRERLRLCLRDAIKSLE
jgi:hypothetical protein